MGTLIHNGINYSGGGGIPTMKITRAQYEAQKAYYDALDALIVITDDNMVITAAGITFNNSGTGMSATNVQGAITELNSNLTNKAPLSPYNGYDTLLSASTPYPFTYTATFDGFLNVQRLVTASPGGFITINNITVASGAGNMELSGLMFPVKIGDVIVFSNINTASRAQMIKV